MAVKQGFKWTFIQFVLPTSTQEHFVEWVKINEKGKKFPFEQLGLDGYKISLVYAYDKQAWCVTVIGTSDTPDNEEKSWSSFSDDLSEAQQLAAYKHYVIADGGDWSAVDNTGAWG